jgi:peroxiredoxin
MGFAVVFLSADAPHNLRTSSQIAALPYDLLSDSQMQAARAFGVAYRVDDFTAGRYEHFGVDLAIVSGESHHELASPAVFIVDRTGMIRFSHWRPTGIRIEAEDLIAAAKKLDGGTHDSVAARTENAMVKE